MHFTSAEKRANERQLDQATQRFKVGLDAITSVLDAQSAYDTSVALEIANKNAIKNTREKLREITGTYHQHLVPLKEKVPLLRPDPDSPKLWTDLAKKRNYTLLASRFTAQAAKELIKLNYSGHFPTVNFFADYRENHSGNSSGTGLLDQRFESLGLEVQVPIYQGGLVVSQTRQAQYDYLTALSELDLAYKATISNTHVSYNNVLSGINIIKADKQAIISADKSLESTEAAFRVGTRTMVDVLIKQKELFDTQKILARDTYDYINNILLLKQAAGILSIADLEEINTWLKTPLAHTTVERFRKPAK